MDSKLMTTREVASYLNLKERKLYDMVAQEQIPCVRVSGKWLFPRELIDNWLLSNRHGPAVADSSARPAVISGSHDPLLDWALRESGCGLAQRFESSQDGLDYFERGGSIMTGLHLRDAEGNYNRTQVQQRLGNQPVVLLHWAIRQQGLIVPADNPHNINKLSDAASRRFALRQSGAGSYQLLHTLMQEQSIGSNLAERAAGIYRSEQDAALAVAEGVADVSLGLATVARQLRLGFIPLCSERFDLLVWRQAYFDEALLGFFKFCRSDAFRQRAEQLGGYDLSEHLSIQLNTPV
ncbi:MAG: substrate-binding domain-containing protein [Granulosicoccaceae bacterium]